MNVEQQMYGSTDWHLPSPSSTPKSASFNVASMQTPKADSYSSHFLEALSTPLANGHTTPAQTPLYSSFPSGGRPSSSYSHTAPRPEDPAFHVNHLSQTPHLPLPPVEPSRRLSSSPDPTASAKTYMNNLKGLSTMSNVQAGNMDLSQMRTPPSTRGSSSRRRAQNTQGEVQRTPSTIVSGRLTSTPSTSNMTQDQAFSLQTPMHFSNFQFSPDVLQFSSAGPLSAPPLPQSKLFWDQNSNINNAMGLASDDPFGPSPQRHDSASVWQEAINPSSAVQSHGFQTMSGPEAASSAPDFWATSEPSIQAANAFSQTGSFASTTSGVDPSLLFSFSETSDMTDAFPANPLLAQTSLTHDSRQPYEHQIRESNREKELAQKARQQRSRTNTASSSAASQNNSRPGLQRSNTDSGFRRLNPAFSESQITGLGHIPRRSSPLKRRSQTSLTAIPETVRSRPRTRLIVDETGRARTETEPIAEDAEVGITGNRQHVASCDDDGSDTDASVGITSQNNSFSFPTQSTNRGKHARQESNAGYYDTSKIQRSSSSASLNSVSSSTSRSGFSGGSGPNTARKPKVNPSSRRFSMPSFGNTGGGGPISEEHIGIINYDAAGDAQSALKKVMEDRIKRQAEQSTTQALKGHNQRWAQASADLSRLSMNQAYPYDPFPNFTASPTTVTDSDFATPTTDRSSLSNDSTRCVCSSADSDGLLMIQCESCTKWLHVKCVGLSSQHIPPVYVCIFCTGQTPAVRGGRVREPARVMPNYTSPLKHKSNYRR